MNRNRKATIALCVFALAGCAADRGYSDSNLSSSTAGDGMSSSNSSGMRSSSSSSSSGMSSTGGTVAANTASPSQQTWYGVVQSIDQMQRQDVGVGVVGAAAAGGSAGLGTDKVYRVTVRMDDGSNQMVAVDSMPSYKIGDRVTYSNGMLNSSQ